MEPDELRLRRNSRCDGAEAEGAPLAAPSFRESDVDDDENIFFNAIPAMDI